MNDIVMTTETSLRKVEGELEAIGRSICSEKNGGAAWQHINRAVGEVQRAIHQCYMMGDE